MKNAIIEYLSCCMMVVMILFLMTAPVVSACASGRKTDSVTGWTFSSPSTYTHAGTKSLTYYYGDSYGESYHTRFTEGKNLWGTNINLQRSTNSDTANHKGRKSVSAIFERRACYDTTKKMASAAVADARKYPLFESGKNCRIHGLPDALAELDVAEQENCFLLFLHNALLN